MRFEQGRIVEAKASRGEEVLKKVLDTDEGARYFGEFAFHVEPCLFAQPQHLRVVHHALETQLIAQLREVLIIRFRQRRGHIELHVAAQAKSRILFHHMLGECGQ